MRTSAAVISMILLVGCGAEPASRGDGDATPLPDVLDTTDSTIDVAPDIGDDTRPDIGEDIGPDTLEDVPPDGDSCEPIRREIQCDDGSTRIFECPCIGGEVICPDIDPSQLCGSMCVPQFSSFVCPDGTVREIECPCVGDEPICPPIDPIALCGLSGPCDDGTILEDRCAGSFPVCAPGVLSAIQNGCWTCVDPNTCQPPIVTGCNFDAECGVTEYCDECATSSCPGCADCVSGCLPHGCPTEDFPLCNAIRPDCDGDRVAVVSGGCWECVSRSECAIGPDCSAFGGFCTLDPVCAPGAEQIPDVLCPGFGACCTAAPFPTCADLGGTCAGDIGFCPAGTTTSGDTCADGSFCCLPSPEPTDCGDLGGVCLSRGVACRGQSFSAGCGEAQLCCVPGEVTECAGIGGACTFWRDGCPDGALEIPELVCNRSQICCVGAAMP